MASGIFAILDDIGALMDDVAIASKLATKKTAGILGDDLAVNAEKATGFVSSREVPVLLKIMKGSFVNKLIIIPIVMLLNYYFPALITGVLVLGGFYLAYEGIEKIVEFLFHRSKESKEVIEELESPDADKIEAEKVKSAIITDFILSLEIVIISLNTVKESPFVTQLLTVSIVAIIATVGVYGLVALIVRMDDAGYSLIKRGGEKGFLVFVGDVLVKALPIVIKSLSVIGTIALILVSGGIFAHNIHALDVFFPNLPSILRETIFGIVFGIFALIVITLFKWLIGMFKKPKA